MPTNFLAMRRTRRCAAANAADFGAEHPYRTSDDRYTAAMCDALEQHLIKKKRLLRTRLITVRAIARSPESLVNSVDKMMRGFAYRWGRRHAVGPDREPLWLDYFIAAAPCEAGHASHGHINISEGLTAAEQRQLEKLAKKRGLNLEFTGNSEEWLASKKNVEKHACKVRYAIRHLLRTGSTYRISASETPAWVRGSREQFNRRRAQVRAALGA